MIISLGVPAYRGLVSAGHILQAVNFQACLREDVGLVVQSVDSCSLDWARNTLIHQAIEHHADWLVMCDADTYTPEGKNIGRMILSKAQVIASPVLTRRGHGGQYNVEIGDRNPGKEEFAGKVIPVDRIGTAMMAIDLRWLATHVKPPWFHSEQTMHEGKPAWRGEDYLFCDKVKAAGGTIMADGRFEPVHSGSRNEIDLLKEYGCA